MAFNYGKSETIDWPVDDDGSAMHEEVVAEFIYERFPVLEEVYAFTRFGGAYVICFDKDGNEMDLAVGTHLALLFEHIWRDEPGYGATIESIWREPEDACEEANG